MSERPNLSYGDVDVGRQEGEGDGSQEEIVVKIVLGVGHLKMGWRGSRD